MVEKVSVVIPAYNAEKFIAEAIKSVFNQLYRPIEIIVVNNGSTDSTIDVVKNLSNLTPHRIELRIIDIGINKGAANALNVGFSSANGEYICWLSADDMFIDKKKIQKQVKRMEKTKANLSYAKYFYEGPTLAEANIMKSNYVPHLPIFDDLFNSDSKLRSMMIILRFWVMMNGSSMMINRDCLEKYGQFDPILCNYDADGDIGMRYSILGIKFDSIQEAPIFRRNHLAQTSNKKLEMMYGNQLTRLRILMILDKYNLLTEYIRKFIPFLPVIFRSQNYQYLPFVSEFICNHIIDNFKNRIFLNYTQRYLDLTRKTISYTNINKYKLYEDVKRTSESPTFKHFERILLSGDKY
jgi:glycosyltransferase involved in cell wall biosynthesis